MNYQLSKLLLLATMLLISIQSIGQANKGKSFSINFGPEMSFPERELRKTHKIGYGGSVKAEYTFGKHASTTINSGVSFLEGRNFFDNVLMTTKVYESLLAIPVKLGLRYYVNNFYVAGEAGMVFLNNFINESRPIASIGVGDKFNIGAAKFDVSFRQEFWFGNSNNLNMAVLRVAYEIVW